MQFVDTIIRNGQVVLRDRVIEADVAIQHGVIVAIERQLIMRGMEEIDATNQLVLPGGIDAHVHMNEPSPLKWEGFKTGSTMLAAGGITTFLDMPLNGSPSTITAGAYAQKERAAHESSLVDFGLWGGLVPGNIEHLQAMADAGVVGFKAFLSDSGNDEFERVDDETLLAGMYEIARLGKILALHAESETMTRYLKDEAIGAGHITFEAYSASRPIEAEVEAVTRALHYARLTKCALHFVHISSAKAVEAIQAAKEEGLDVTLETCPHYLLFNEGALHEFGAVAKCAPPLRNEQEQHALQRLFAAGKFDFITSDHSPAPYALKDLTKRHIFEAWGGINGGQFTYVALLELAIKHHLPLPFVARFFTKNVAERFSLTQKGELAVGYDADITIMSYNPQTATVANMEARHKESIYEGHTFPVRVERTIVRGKTVWQQEVRQTFSYGKAVKTSEQPTHVS
ncbi:MAG: allantoinase AllB [Caryophanon sp.]|nr:allantoinase AllB [Caryophanon sp.]